MITNRNCIVRLSRYKKALYRFKAMGFVKFFSDTLGEAVGVAPSQVRKDFSLFGISGNRRGGYNLDQLIKKLQNILGKDQIQKVVVVGMGNIGKALISYRGFEKEGIQIVSVFDIDPAKFEKDQTVPVLPLNEFKSFVQDNNILIGIIAVPDIAAQQVLDMMSASGVRGVLNFAPIRLKSDKDTVISNVNFELELENLIYFVNAAEKQELINEDKIA